MVSTAQHPHRPQRPLRITSLPPRRRPGGPRGRRVPAVLLAAALAALLVFTAGMWLGRATARHDPPPAATAAGAPAGPQAQHGVAVPVGWPRTREGAVGAATAYLAAVSGRGYLRDPATRTGVVRAIVDPAQIPAVLAADRPGQRPPAGSPLAAAFADPTASAWRHVPVGYRLDSYTPNRAVVSVWVVQLAAGTGATPVPATATWGTTTVPLRWIPPAPPASPAAPREDTRDVSGEPGAGDWKLDVAGLRAAPGPTPAVQPGALSSDLDVIAADRTFSPYLTPPAASAPREDRDAR